MYRNLGMNKYARWGAWCLLWSLCFFSWNGITALASSKVPGRASSKGWFASSYALTMGLDTLGLVENPGLGVARAGLPWRGAVLMQLQAGIGAKAKVALDLVGEWKVESVRWEGRDLPFRYGSGRLEFSMHGFEPGAVHPVEVLYSGYLFPAAKPPWQDGLVVSADSLGYPRLGMTCQGSGARSWWPCLDDAAQEPDSLSLTMSFPAYAAPSQAPALRNPSAVPGKPALLDLVANGRRVADTVVGNRRTVTWKVTQPINLYNVTFNIGRYARFLQPYADHQGVERELEFFVSPEDLNKARSHMAQSVDMMSCYEKTLGPYAFWKDGYKVIQSSYLGMEHQSAVAYGNGFRNNEWGFDFILVHESGHEWWGNSVSASDPSDWWIHEGLTTLMEAVFLECRDGNRKQADAYMVRMRRKIQNQKPMQGPRGRRFAAHDVDIYYKGAWMFYSLRNSVGNDSLWSATLGSAYQKFALQTISTEQMVDHWAQALGSRYAGTLHWWLNHAECPVLEWEMVSNKGDTTTSQVRYRWARTARGIYLPMGTASGQCLNPQAGRWQTMVWKTPGHALTQAERLWALQAEMTNLTKRYLIRVQRLKGGL
jgi:aminopeptidase N